MDSEPTDEQTGVEDELKKSVEIVVETDAEVGASGYSVTGGGERGIFVKDVLKDSPAAKHLSLQQGDQLLSAKVYFENVRYEDALKILQCAEPYKVSFQLKRTVPETEVSVRPRVPGGEVKGPKAKVAKMSVKGTKLFKTQKRRGGRFGLKRLKEKNREELVIEGTPPRLEAGDVDVEFSLPKFKQRKGVQEAEPAAGKGKKRIRFPHMKTKSYTGAVTGGKLGTGQLEVDENIYPPETSRAGIKTKGKGHKFGIAFPKSKHNKSGSDSQTGSLERKPPEVRIHPPSVEFDVSSDKDVEKRGLKFKTPDVEFALPSGKAEASVSTVEDTSGSKAPKGDFRGEAEVAGGKVHADVSKGDAKLRMPKLKLPKVRLSRHSDEIDSAFKVKTPKAEIKGDGELQLPEGNIRMPKVEGDLSGGAASVQIPSVDISLPKGKGKFDAGVSLPESGVKAGVNMPDIEVAGSDIDLELTTGQKIPDEVESMVKGPKISMPKVDISLPKAGSAGVEGPDVGGKFSLPSVDISLPQMNSGGGDVDMDCYVGGDGKFKMPEFDPAFPNVKSLDGEGTFKLPKVDLSLPKGKAGTSDDDRAAFQLPSMEVSLPNMKGDKVEVNTKGGKLKMPEVEISPPKGHLQGGFEVEGKAGKKSKKGKKLKMPTVDVSMPKLTQPEGHIEGPEMTSGGGIQLPSHDASLPTAKMKGNIEIEGPSAKGGRFTMPSVNVKLPQMGSSEAGVDLHERKTGVVSGDVSLKPMGDIEGKVEGEKFTLPSVDVSLPKMKLPKGDVTLEGPDLNLSLPSSDGKASGESGGGKFKMPSCDISLQKGKVKEGEVNIRGPEAKGGKFQMPSFDVSLPQMKKRGGDVDVELPKLKGGDIKAPTIEISGLQGTFEGDYDLDSYRKEGGYSLPGMKFPEGEGNFQGPKVKGAKFEMPKIDLSLPRGRKQGGDFDVEVYSRKDGSIEMPSCDFDGPKGELSTDINVDGLEGKTGKFKMPKIDISLPKLNLPEGEIHIEGPEIKGQMEKPSLDITPPEGKLDVDIDSHKTKGSKFHMPTINVNLPKIKSKEVSIDVKGPEGPEGKLPSCDITVPDKKFPKADVSLEGPNVKGGHVSMPGVEVSLPKTKGNVGISVDTPEGNGEKLQMPKFDISLPKVNFPESAGKTKKIDLKTKKMEMPDIDVSLPKGKAEADIEIDGGKGRKFHIPSVDFSLPRIKTKGSEIKTEGVEGKVHVPDTDVSLSKGKVEVNTNVEGGEVKGGKFKMPKFDISFPNMNLPEGKPEVDVSITKGKIKENVDLGGKFPTVEISPPKIQARDIDVGITTPEGANLDISLPKASLPGGDIKVEGPNIKGPKIEMPDIDLSLPKGKGRGDIEITGGSHKGGKFHMPAIDITLPKMKTKGADVHVEGPEVKGGQIKIPSLDVSGPKLKSPDVDVSLKGPEIEGQFKKPKGDISLPKGEVQGDFEVEGPDMKGGKFKMPKFDVSLPKVSLPKFDANIEGPDVKGKAQMPNVDISVPKATTDVVVDVGTGKGSKFHMPSLDISLPKVKTKGPNVNVEGPEVRGDMSLPEIESPDLDINLQGPKVKGGNLNLPTVDVAFPKTEGDFEVEGPDMKGGKFKMPKFDVSLPKVSLPKFDANIEGPDVKGKAQMPSVDISVPKATADVGVDVDTGKGTKFHMPSFDISLPKMKTKGPNINLEGPEVRGDMSLPKITSPEADINLQGPTVEGGNLSLPTVDVAFPTTEGDFEVEGPDMKGGKFKMPKFDVSLPKVSLPKFDVNIEGPDVKGKAQMPSVDISVPKATTDVGVDVDTGKGSKFHMPSFDISLPKIKAKGPNINLEGPEVRGDMSLPKVKSPDLDVNLQGPEVERGDMSMPTLDVSLSKPEGEFEVQGPEVKGGKIKMPKFPKVGLPEVDVKLKGPDINVGKIEMPDIDISLPKGKVKGDAELEAHTGKRGKFHMPAIDISLPKIKTKEPEINIKGPEVKGGKIPDIDLSLPRGEVDADLSFDGPEKKGGHLKMPKVNVSLPKFELKGEGKVEGIDVEGNIDKTIPKISLPEEKAKGNVNIEGHGGKTSKFHLPSIDISLPKIKVKGVETEGLEGKGEISVPKGKLQGNINVEGSGIKDSEHTTPTFDVSLPKVSLPGGDIKIEGPNIKGPKIEMPDIDLSLPKGKGRGDIEITGGSHKGGKFHMPAIDITLPKMKTKGAEVHVEVPEVKGGQIKIASLDVSGPKLKSPDVDVSLKGPEIEGQFKKPKGDISLPKGEVQGDFEVEGPDMKGGKFKMPKFDVSLPKVSLPKFDANIGGPDVKGKVEMPNVDISVPKATTDVVVDVGTGKGSKFHVPSLDISLPKMKTKGPNINLEGPEVRGDMSLPEIKSPDLDINLQGPTVKGGNLSLPTVDVAFPKTEGDFEVEGPDMKGGKFKVPKFDVSLPKVSLPKFDANIEGPDVKGKAQMPSVDISVPKATTDVRVDVDTGKGTKFHMPSFDISLPKIKAKGPNINLEGPEVRGDMSLPKVKSPDLDVNLQGPEVERGDMNMPTLDVSLSKPEGEFEVQGPGVKGGKIKMPKLPKVGLPEVDVKLKGPDINVGKIEMPDIDISLPKGKVKGDAELEAHTGKRGKFHMPAIDISLPKIKTKEPEINIKGPEVKGGKIPDIDLSLPRGEVDADLSFDGPEKKGGHLKMPKVDVSLPQIKLAGDVTVEGPEMKGKTNEPAVGFSKGDGQMEGDLKKGLGLHMPNIDLHLPKLDFDLSLPSGSRGQGLKVETGGSDASADVHIPGTKGQLKPPKVKATDASINTGSEDTPGASLKLPTVKLPTVDISAPKVDLDFGLTKSKSDDVEVELLKAEGGRPSSGGSFDLPDVSLKVPGFNFPRFGGKSKSSELQISKPEVSISPPDVEGELRAPSVEFDDEGKVKVKKPKIKMPTFGISRKNPDVSVSCPEVDVKAKKEYVDIPTPNINVEGSDDRTKYKVKLPKFKISSPKPKLPEKEGDVKVEADGKGGFHAPDVTIKLPKFSMPGFGSKEKDLGKPVGEVEAKTKLKMPSVELSLPETKTPDTEVLLPKAEVDVSEADIKGYEGNLKVPKMPKIDISIPKVDLDVSLPKGKSQKIEKPDTEVKGEGKFKIPQITMPSLDVSIPKGKSGDYDSPDVEVDVDRGKFNMPYVKMPSVDITFPKPKTGKPLDVDVDRDGNKLRMPDIKMPNVNISKENSDKLEGPDVDVQGRGKLKMPNVDINLSRGKKSDVNAPDLETPDVTTEWDTDRRFKMPSVDISLPKGKLKGNNPPDIEMGVQGEGKVKLPHVKMPDFDVSFPKRRSKDPQMEIKEKDGNLKTPNVSTPSVDFSLSTGKDVDVEESSGGKFKLPHWKMPDVDISLPKGHVEGPEEELTREKGGLKMPHIRLPSVDISLPKGRADGPNVERGDGEEKFSSPYTKMPSVDISVTKGKSVDPNVELKGEGGTKFQMPHVKMPNVEFSLPKGKDVSKFEPEGEKEKLKMPSVDISMPTGKIHSPKAEVEGGKLQGPHIKMPHVNISLPKGKSDKSEGAKVDYSPEIKGERKKFKMVKEDISLPKGRVLVEGPEVDMKGDASMASAKAEGGNIKLPHMKFPKVDISLPKGRSKGSSSPAMEMSVTGPEGELPKVPSSKADIELPSVEAQGKLRVPQGAHLDSSSEGDHDSLKLKIPTIQIKGPKEDLELETGSHKEEGNKVKKSVELPDLDLTLEGSSDIGKGPKTKGGKFKIRKHKKKTGKDASTKPHSEDEVEERVKHNSSKDGKDDIIVQLPGVTPPSVSLKPSTADVRVPRIPDIEFDIGTSQDEDEGRTENKIKIPKFGIPLPSISSPERLAHGPEVQYEGPKIPKVKKAVFVLVNPSEPDASATSPSLQREQTKAGTETEEVTVKMSKKKMKTSFGKSKDKSATESAERKAEEEEKSRGLKMKMPKVKFSPAKSGSSGVKGDKEDKDASPHKDDKGTFGGKLKLPKVELTSPYGKMAAGEENKGARLEKEADRGLPAPAESAGDVVSSQARTEMLDRDSSESPEGFNMEFSSAKVQMWSDSKGTEERESSSWFKVPKVTLKPLSSGKDSFRS
ncbi:neuroblast differentiation-associated protein AHNAK isoform X2 [Oryzias melastigma]|uniref:neuroblast differentiation-associated protein AHNAK isoform X2 n=1 Tax=Oryzias melastigma TaxID=30732 RepID=UPI00168D683C|nr:neuroblast differentiation-associated protein AHNAK isoform X2 [Oryzias melastigma]